MTDWKLIWNDFCDDVAKSVRKNDIERYFEKNIAKELLSACGWGKYSGLMEQYEIAFATTSGKADFALIVDKDSHSDVIIELKRPKNKKKDKYTKQLHDYMKQGECDFGILMLGSQMEIYNRRHSSIQLVDIIKYEHDNEAAHYLIDLLARDKFSIDKVSEYCCDKLAVNHKIDYWSSPEGIKRMKKMIASADGDLSPQQQNILISSMYLSITRQTAKSTENIAIKKDIKIVSNDNSKDINTPRLFSQTTLVSYLRNLNSETTRMIVKELGIMQPIAQITDINLLNKIAKNIKVYEKKHGIHHTHSCAVSKYIEYIKHGLTYQDFEYDAMLVKNSGKKIDTPNKRNKKSIDSLNHRKPFEFSMVGLKEGNAITFTPLNIDVTVNGKNTISYNGKTYSLTGFCKVYLPQDMRIPSNAYQGPKYFSYDGEDLWTLRLKNEDRLRLEE